MEPSEALHITPHRPQAHGCRIRSFARSLVRSFIHSCLCSECAQFPRHACSVSGHAGAAKTQRRRLASA